MTQLAAAAHVAAPARPTTWRGDIEGLRGVAVAAVVLYHAGVPGLGGGYIGVDVFFVLSGFLITGLLVDGLQVDAPLKLGAFYARRVRRLLPASVLVFVATVLLALWLLPPLQVLDLQPQAMATAVYASNIWFAQDATNYLRPETVSPFQQYWSLALEEQFYLVWPFALALFARGSRSRDQLLRRVGVGVAAVVVVSFGLSVYLTEVRQPWAFFLLPARAWELAAGGLIALAVRGAFARRWRPPAAAGWLGMASIVAAAVVFTESTPFPGWAALLPVVGTVAVIWAGAGSEGGGVGRVLSVRPLRELGRYSYSLYLWHWPLLVLPAAAVGGELDGSVRAMLVVVAGGLAVATFHLVENPVRFAAVLVGRPARSAVLGLSLTAVAVGSTVLLASAQERDVFDSGREPVAAGEPSSFVPVGMAPSIVESRSDQPVTYDDGCHLMVTAVDTPPCRYGEVGAGTEVLLLGDSHAAHWFPGMEAAALDAGWSLRAVTKSDCPAVAARLTSPSLNRRYVECEQWRSELFDQVLESPPALVVMGHSSPSYVKQLGEDRWVEALAETVALLSRSTTVVVMRDTPAAERSVPDCLMEHLEAAQVCEPRQDRELAELERRAVESAGGVYIDSAERVCPGGRCPVVVGATLVYRDAHHLSTEFSVESGSWLRSELDSLVRG